MRAFNLIALMAAVPAATFAQTGGRVPPPAQRVATLELARNLLVTTPIEVDAEDLAMKNPFGPRTPVVKDEPVTPVQTVVRSATDREVLVNVIANINPSGTMMIGDQPFLLFGQKKLKVGDVIPIGFQGKTYELVLTGIERTSFTLRLNKEEITRPIKPANKP